jgi:3-hydroxybutyrate dehydrogenase
MFRNKTALITGSTSGIGLGIAKAMAEQGANIVLNGFGKSEDIEAARKSIESLGVKVIYNGADMTKPDQIAAMVEDAIKAFGSVDILVNNAGIQHVAAVESFPPEKWDAIIAIDLSSSFHTIRAAVPKMREKGWGRIVNIASIHALVASPFKSAYVAAKHGLLGLTKVIALETAQNGITVNAICPGYVDTPLVRGQVADTARVRGITEDEVIKNVMLGPQWTKQFVAIDEIAQTALFLCSDAAKNITGTSIAVDGGWTAA